MKNTAIVIGNTDGIGLALTRQLLERGFQVTGISKRPATLAHDGYTHVVLNVLDADYCERLTEILPGARPSLCIYCAGIGDVFSLRNIALDTVTFDVNLMGLVRTAAVIVPCLVASGGGVFTGLSSLADVVPTSGAPAYAASKIGMTYYLEGLAGAVAEHGIAIVNVRLGFVDTKMAKAPRKPWIISADEAARRILRGVLSHRPPARLNIPLRAAVIFGLAALIIRVVTRCMRVVRGR